MKKPSFLLLIVVAFFTASFSTQETIWLDKDLNETNQSNAVYYKIGNKSEGIVFIFFKNRTVFRKVQFSNAKLEGLFYEYYETGELKETGKYENGHREGNWKEFYKNGKIKRKGKYENGEKVGTWKVFYKNDK